MNLAIAALVGIGLGLAAHDLAIQALREKPLRPFLGACANCDNNRGWASYRCAHCGRSVGREILVAFITGTVAIGMVSTLGLSWALIPYGGFLLLTAALAITDVDAMRIVDRLNLRGSGVLIVLLGVTSLLDGRLDGYLRGLGGGAVFFAGALLLFLIVRGNGFGAGDVKLAPLLGVFTTYLGWAVLGQALLVMAAVGGLGALVALIFMSASRHTELPYGPAMIVGAWVAIALVGIGT